MEEKKCCLAFPKILAAGDPYFAEPMSNTTATVGREAILKCTIENLDSFKVAWIKVDTQTLLTLDTHVISRDRRLKITNSNKRQWFLNIKDVSVLDRGYYMCQINTEPMISQEGFLDVMVQRVEGEFLNLTQVTREDMGAYLCIAKNGIPPTVSKRIVLQVNFPPKIKVANQMVYAAGGTDAILGCHLEASPRPLTSWVRHDDVVLINNNKYEIVEKEDSYKIIMQLKIRNVSDNDFGHYKCVANNMFGDKEGFVRLIEQITTTTTAMSTIPYRVFIPIQRVVTESQPIPEGTTTAKKEYGAPTTNSLRDESQVVSSEKQLGPGKVESRLEDESNQRRTIKKRPKSTKDSTSGSTEFFVISHLTLFAAASFNLFRNSLLKL
ncbi:Lachesin like protein [Argiope bruennichi]|uniref:Lachesin like protein n=1 Tax=Argiope bruennichi TaxID=94029 RepID=A0A8T0E678_ARGBR|nr:Lachesin like protein [Argiope bruennichi]